MILEICTVWQVEKLSQLAIKKVFKLARIKGCQAIGIVGSQDAPLSELKNCLTRGVRYSVKQVENKDFGQTKGLHSRKYFLRWDQPQIHFPHLTGHSKHREKGCVYCEKLENGK